MPLDPTGLDVWSLSGYLGVTVWLSTFELSSARTWYSACYLGKIESVYFSTLRFYTASALGVGCGGGEGAAMAWLAAARAVEATEATEAMGAVAGGWWEGGIYGVKP